MTEPKLVGMTLDDARMAEHFRVMAKANGHFAIGYGLMKVAESIHWLGNGDAATQMGGLEAVGKELQDGMNQISTALSEIAAAIPHEE